MYFIFGPYAFFTFFALFSRDAWALPNQYFGSIPEVNGGVVFGSRLDEDGGSLEGWYEGVITWSGNPEVTIIWIISHISYSADRVPLDGLP